MTMLRLATTMALLLLTACGGGQAGPDDTVEAAGHIHGLGVDPADGTTYVATHEGLYRAGSGVMEPVGELRRDLMGFTVTGPRTFLSSGHPAPGEDVANPLGVVRSTDGGATWTTVALAGQVDFHALEAAGNVVYGYDGAEQRLLASSDGGRNWQSRAALAAADVAADPRDPSVLLATTRDGVLISRDAGSSFAPTAAPLLVFVSWSPDGTVYGVAPDGVVHASTDGASNWSPRSTVPGGEPRAIAAVDATRLLAATAGGVYESRDDGRTFARLA